MKKGILGIFLLLILANSMSLVLAYPPCGAFHYPQEGAFCAIPIIANELVRVRQEVPFVWIRAEPSSHAAILATVLPSTSASMISIGDENSNKSISWDGYQWWWEVELYPNGGSRGWVEMASLANTVQDYPRPDRVSDPSIEILADWVLPLFGKIEAGTSFVWVRETPSSGGRIVYTLRENQVFELTGGNRYDAYQWWWAIRFTVGSQSVEGWIEQGSISPIR